MKAFYMVYKDEGQACRIKHNTLESALQEAKRLARVNPGDTFIVLKGFLSAKIPVADVLVETLND